MALDLKKSLVDAGQLEITQVPCDVGVHCSCSHGADAVDTIRASCVLWTSLGPCLLLFINDVPGVCKSALVLCTQLQAS